MESDVNVLCVCVFVFNLILSFSLPLLSLQTLMIASLIHARMEEPASMRSTPLCVFVSQATAGPLVRKVTMWAKSFHFTH